VHTGAARFARAKTTRPIARDRQRRDPNGDCPVLSRRERGRVGSWRVPGTPHLTPRPSLGAGFMPSQDPAQVLFKRRLRRYCRPLRHPKRPGLSLAGIRFEGKRPLAAWASRVAGNAPLISLRPSLITEHPFVSTLNDLAPNLAPRSAQLGLGMANGQPRALGCECWFRYAPPACQHAPASRKRPSDR